MRIKRDSLPFYLLILVSGIVFFSNLNAWDIYILDEAKNVEAAREMWLSQDFIVPRFNGKLRFDKPPLHYYFFAISFNFFGLSAFAARFFPALMGVITACLLYRKVSLRLGKPSAFWAVFLFISSVHVQLQFKLAVPDPFLITFLTFSVLSLESWFSSRFLSKKYLRYASFYLSLAFLSKGPIALVLVGGALIIYWMIQPKHLRSNWIRLFDPLSIVIFLGIGLPWYLAVYWTTDGEWLREFLFHHHVNRFSQTMEGHGGPFYLTFLMAFFGFFPGILFLFKMVFCRVGNLLRDPLMGLSLVFCIWTLLFFSFSSTKLPNYAAPIYPFLAILTAKSIEIKDSTFSIDTIAVVIGGLAMIGFCLFVGFYLPEMNELQGLGQIFPFLLIPVVAACIALYLLWLGKIRKGIVSVCLAYLILGILLQSLVLPRLNSKNPIVRSREIWIDQELYFWKEFNPAFPFNSNSIVKNWEDFPCTDCLILTSSRAIDRDPFPKPFEILFRGKDLFENTETLIIQPIFDEK